MSGNTADYKDISYSATKRPSIILKKAYLIYLWGMLR